MNKDPKMVAMHFFVADWISGTRVDLPTKRNLL